MDSARRPDRTDYKTRLFPGAARLMELADAI
jgi:hypothetical protein